MDLKTYINHGGVCYGATIQVGSVTCNATRDRGGNSAAFVQGASGKWRCVEWFTIPDEVKDAMFEKAESKADDKLGSYEAIARLERNHQ